MRTSEGVYFAYMVRRNPWKDRVQIWFGYRDPGRNHVYQIWWRSVKGFLVGGVPKFALSHWLCRSSLQQCLRYRVHCDAYATACTVMSSSFSSCSSSFCSSLVFPSSFIISFILLLFISLITTVIILCLFVCLLVCLFLFLMVCLIVC